jgi:flagellar protein FlgJ
MDISSLNTDYQSYLSNSSTATAKMDQIKNTDYKNATDEELMDACKQFEEYFVEMALKEVFKTVDLFGMGESTSNAMSTSKDFMKDSIVQKFAEKITEESGLGLAQQLYESMKRNTIDVSELPE